MTKQQTRVFKFMIRLWLMILAFFAANDVSAQIMKQIYDGRAEIKTAKISAADENFLKREALPIAREAWKNDEGCEENFEIQDAASGAFTRQGATQKAFLYRFCETGHNFGKDGIVVVENGRIVAHYFYDGGWDSSIIALPDINGNGINEIALGESGMNQGYGWSVITIIELQPEGGVEKFGIFDTWSDNCGAVEKNCQTEAYVLSVKPGDFPAFQSQKYRQVGKTWRTVGKAVKAKPRDDESSYLFAKPKKS